MKFSARILASLSFCHLLNDLMQSLLPSIYPMLKQTFGLSFRQIGLITLVSQITASLLQPVIGVYTDRRPQPSLARGRHGVYARRDDAARVRSELRGRPRRRGAHRARLCRLPSRVVANRAPRVGRTPRVCAGVLPGRRKRRARRSARCSRRFSCCRTAAAASRGFR